SLRSRQPHLGFLERFGLYFLLVPVPGRAQHEPTPPQSRQARRQPKSRRAANMRIPAVRKTVLWTIALALAGGLSLCSPRARAEEPTQRDSPAVTKLLKEARNQAVQLRMETDRLESYKNAGLSRESHIRQLQTTKDHVNELGKTLDKLEARKADASDW